MTVYVDVVFMENFILNSIIIISTAILCKSRINIKRLIISSSFGGIFSIVNYVIIILPIFNFLFKIVISLIMILIAFKTSNVKKTFEQILFFYLVSFTFGGIAFAFIFLLKSQNIIITKNLFIGNNSINNTVLVGVTGLLIIVLVSKILKYRIYKKNIIFDLEIFYNGKSQKIKTMLDTGNLLKEPITQNDVIIVEKKSLINIVSKDILENMSSIINGKWIESKETHLYNFVLIPFSTLGNENGLLIGFKPDYIKILKEDELLITNVFIGIYDGKLSKDNLYTSLIGLDIINKEET